MSNSKTSFKRNPLRAAVAAASATGLLFAGTALGGEYRAEMRDAWIDGKLETAYTLNRHLNAFTIDTHVENGNVLLKGTVSSEIDRELAEHIAKGMDGVNAVKNDLVVRPSNIDRDSLEPGEKRKLAQWIDDATTTAAVKSRLLANDHTHGLTIDVDTKRDVVTLSGMVRSPEEKELAERIAENTRGVDAVRNQLVVRRGA